jgi:hypothetical protein
LGASGITLGHGNNDDEDMSDSDQSGEHATGEGEGEGMSRQDVSSTYPFLDPSSNRANLRRRHWLSS